MLARRAVSRSFSYLRQDALKYGRTRLLFPPRAHFHSRPATISGRMWYKSDGTPRSRLKGIIIGTIASATFYTMYTMLSLLDEFDTANYLLSCLVHIQRIDADFPSVDLSNFRSTHSHFLELCSTLFGDIPQQMIDDFFNDVYNLTGSLKSEAHKILQDSCEDVHEIIRGSKGLEPVETAGMVVKRLDEGLAKLVEMVEDTYNDEIGKVLRNQKIKEQVIKDPARSSGDYEVVG